MRSHVVQIEKSCDQTAEQATAAFELSLQYAESQVNALVFGKFGLPSGSNDGKSQDWIVSAMKCCLNATREFLETFSSLPILEYRDLSFVQWAQLVQILKLVPTLCFKDHNIIGWHAAQIRKELRLRMILESLCYRMQELTQAERNTDVQEGVENRLDSPILPPNWFLMFKSVLKILKDTYDRRCEEAERDERMQQTGLGCPVLNGSIQDSEFWFELMEFQRSSVADAGLTDAQLSGADPNSGVHECNSGEWSDFDLFDFSQT